MAGTEKFGNMVPMMEFLAKAKFSFGGAKPALAAAQIAGGMEVFVNLEGHVDFEAERLRVTKRIEKVEQAIASVHKRLSNEEFVKSAPPNIVAGARKQLEDNEKELNMLRDNLNATALCRQN